MADFDEMKNAIYNAIHPDPQIPLSNEVIYELIEKWGSEIILQCKCKKWPSHSMWGQKGYGKCGQCNELCTPIFQSWSIPTD